MALRVQVNSVDKSSQQEIPLRERPNMFSNELLFQSRSTHHRAVLSTVVKTNSTGTVDLNDLNWAVKKFVNFFQIHLTRNNKGDA